MLERLANLSIIQTGGFAFRNIKFSTECILNNSNRKQSTEYMVDQYSEYSVSRDEDDGAHALYSVSQHVPATAYGALCPTAYPAATAPAPTTDSWGHNKRNQDQVNTPDKHNKTEGLSRGGGGGTGGGSTQSQLPTCVYFMSHIAVQLSMEDAASASADHVLHAILASDELGLNKQLCAQLFSIWLYSPLLELQLKAVHKPYEIRRCWRSLLEQYSHGSYNRKQTDEPIVSFQRNIFFPQHLEEKIKDQKIIELLYEEARYNVLEGRYPVEAAHYIMLGGIQARIELGPYNPQLHSTHYFREEQSKYLPAHVRKSSTWTWLPISSKSSAEVRLLEQFKRIPQSATNRKLMRKYLEFCWSLPYYGAAFFEGQIEQPVRGLTSLMTHQDIPVLVAINARGVYVIDDMECTLLLGLKYSELSWDQARPSKEDDPNCLPCLFLQFLVIENGARVSKILQVFSRQVSLMDRVITAFVHQRNKHKQDNNEPDHAQTNHHPVPTDDVALGPVSTLSNKLSRLTLSTFDEDGHCIGQMGSWSFGY